MAVLFYEIPEKSKVAISMRNNRKIEEHVITVEPATSKPPADHSDVESWGSGRGRGRGRGWGGYHHKRDDDD